jgi:hypothetical protein
MQIMDKRQANLRKVLRWWAQGNFNSSINTILQLKDASINKDFLDMTFGTLEPQTDQLNLMTMDGARGVLNIA